MLHVLLYCPTDHRANEEAEVRQGGFDSAGDELRYMKKILQKDKTMVNRFLSASPFELHAYMTGISHIDYKKRNYHQLKTPLLCGFRGRVVGMGTLDQWVLGSNHDARLFSKGCG